MEQKPLVKQGTLLFFVTFLIFATSGIYLQRLNIRYGLIITEWVIVLLPVLIYIKYLKLDFRSTLRLNPLNLREFLLSVGVGLTGWLTASVFGIIVALIFWLFGHQIPQLPIPIPQNINEFLVLTFIISISAGICEETLFRGFIMQAFGNWGVKWSIIMPALLFALMHGSVYRFLPIFFLGIVYGWVAWRTNSIISTMIAHSINNGLSLVVLTIVSASNNNPIQQTILGIIMLLVFIISIVLFPIVLTLIYRTTNPPIRAEVYNGNRLLQLFKLWSFNLGLLIYVILAGLEIYSIFYKP